MTLRTVKERSSPKDPNYSRLYEFDPGNSQICSNCPAKCGTGNWNSVLSRVRGVPVHTNWPATSDQRISLVYVCESPSNREFSHGLPTVGATGQGIYKREKRLNNIQAEWLDWLDDKVYRTNLVRCQADSGLQKRVDSLKDSRVEEAAIHCIEHLRREVEVIVRSSQADQAERLEFVVSIGSDFLDWQEMVKEFIRTTCESANVQCSIREDKHPSARGPAGTTPGRSSRSR